MLFYLDTNPIHDYRYRITITKSDTVTRNFFTGFIRLHLLHHAGQEPIFGLDMIRELARHGYQLSPGTLYHILHGLERHHFLVSHKEMVAGKVRKVYTLTESGRAALDEALLKVHELID